MSDPRLTDLFNRALGAFRISDYELAETLVKQLLNLNDDDAQAYMLLGSIYGRKQLFSKAISQFNRAVALVPDNPEAFNNIGVMYRHLGQLDEAKKAVRKALEFGEDRPDIYYNLGNILKQQNKLDDARQAYVKCLSLDGNFVLAYNNLGTIYETEGAWTEAQSYYEKGLQVDPNNPTLRYNLGLIYQRQGKLVQAKEAVEGVLRSKPRWPAAMNTLGRLYQSLNKPQDARRLYEEILNDDPDNTEAVYCLGSAYEDLGDSGKARNYFQKALAMDPKYAPAALHLVQTLEKEQKLEEGVDLLSRFAASDPGNLSVRLQLGKYRILQGQYTKAEEDLLAVLNTQSDNQEALRALGQLYLKTGRSKLAHKVSERILRLNSKNGELIMDMALHFFNLSQWEPAAERVQAFLNIHPEDFNARMLLGNLFLQSGNLERAVQIYEDLLKDNPGNQTILGALARAYQTGGDQTAALEVADQILQIQGKGSGENSDMSILLDTLETYEKAAQSMGKDLQESWDRNLKKLVERPQQPESAEVKDEESVVLEEPEWAKEKPSLPEGQSSLMDFGDLNPAIVLNEEEETIRITESNEELHYKGLDDEEEEEEEILPVGFGGSGSGSGNGMPAQAPASSGPSAPAALPAQGSSAPQPPAPSAGPAAAQTQAPAQPPAPPQIPQAQAPQPQVQTPQFQTPQPQVQMPQFIPYPMPSYSPPPNYPPPQPYPAQSYPPASYPPPQVQNQAPAYQPPPAQPPQRPAYPPPQPTQTPFPDPSGKNLEEPEAQPYWMEEPVSEDPGPVDEEIQILDEDPQVQFEESEEHLWEELEAAAEDSPRDPETMDWLDEPLIDQAPEEEQAPVSFADEVLPAPDFPPMESRENPEGAEEGAFDLSDPIPDRRPAPEPSAPLPFDDDWGSSGPGPAPNPEKVSDLMDYLGKLSQYLPHEKKMQLIEDDIPLKMEKIRLTLSQKEEEAPAAHAPVPSLWPQKGDDAATMKAKLKTILSRVKDKIDE